MNDAVELNKARNREMAEGITDSNVQLAGQADVLTTVGGLLPGAPAVAAGPNITYNIDARGADREGLGRLAAVVREQGAHINYVDKTIERRAVGAMAYARGRDGNIARAFGGW